MFKLSNSGQAGDRANLSWIDLLCDFIVNEVLTTTKILRGRGSKSLDPLSCCSNGTERLKTLHTTGISTPFF